ncbi:La- protein 4 [Apophysomyces ossiformis]|uniref:La- protein 4 n=1 Tax=Apophysomyces ossiformis TaxID=679940 RepID=A0A8H7ESR8_9FUNG|nr:La- protein 4 [Apophysomyces ossiformis]
MDPAPRDEEQDDLEIIMHDDEINSSSVFGSSKAAYELNNSISDSSKYYTAPVKIDLKRQLEYYFSRQNLANDAYLVSQMDSELYVPIVTIAKFRRVREWTTDIDLIVKTLRESSAVIIDETGTKVKPNISVQRTTIILRDVPETTEQEISDLLRELDSPPIKNIKKDIGNMWYITFESEEDALKMLFNIRGKSFKGMPIAARMKSEPILRSIQPRKSVADPEKQASPTSSNLSASPHVTPLTSPVSDTSSRASDISLPSLVGPYGCFYPYNMAVPMSYGHRWNSQYPMGSTYHNRYYNSTDGRSRYWNGYSGRSKQRYGNEYRNNRQESTNNGHGSRINGNQVNRKPSNNTETNNSETEQLLHEMSSISVSNSNELSNLRGTSPQSDENQPVRKTFRGKVERSQQHLTQTRANNDRNISNTRKKPKDLPTMAVQRPEKQNDRRINKDKIQDKGVPSTFSARRRVSVPTDASKQKRKATRDKGKKGKSKDDDTAPNLQPANFPPLPTKAGEQPTRVRDQDVFVPPRSAADVVRGKQMIEVDEPSKNSQVKVDLDPAKAIQSVYEDPGKDGFPSLDRSTLNKPASVSYADMLKKSSDDKQTNAS